MLCHDILILCTLWKIRSKLKVWNSIISKICDTKLRYVDSINWRKYARYANIYADIIKVLSQYIRIVNQNEYMSMSML